MNRGAYAMIGAVNARLMEATSSLTNTLMMPFLTSSISRELTNENQSYMISLRPAFSKALKAMLLRIYGWRNFSALYDHNEALYRIKNVLEDLYKDSKKQQSLHKMKGAGSVDMRYIQDMENLYPLLRSMDQHLRFSQSRNILIDVAKVSDVHKLLDAVSFTV